MPYNYLAIDDRVRIQELIYSSQFIVEIAAKVHSQRSTIYREIIRNTSNGIYISHKAESMACEPRYLNKPRQKKEDRRVLSYKADRLKEYWSPEQISGRIKIEYPHDESMRIGHETIYQLVH